MLSVIGNITSLEGSFFAKSPDGSFRELSKGSAIHEGEVVVGANGNELMDNIVVAMQDGSNIVVYGNEKQLFDSSLTKKEFSEDETVSDPDSLQAIFEGESNLDNLETAAGEEAQHSTERSVSSIVGIAHANDNSQNVESDLRVRDFSVDRRNDNAPFFNEPVVASTTAPTQASTTAPTHVPTTAPTEASIHSPTTAPTQAPTQAPTTAPTEAPTQAPTTAPTEAPTQAPTTAPTEAPTTAPTEAPTQAPTTAPTEAPTTAPTEAPTQAPTTAPTEAPTTAPTESHENNDHGNGDQDAPGNSGSHNNAENVPTQAPTTAPTEAPTTAPTESHENNGHGNGDQDAPGNSGSHNNAENVPTQA
ncbi:MAG: hypothetical protein NTW78_05390, partial [Campylobacterales bacterium]|nr:hypothetical protein [Campylobacterales bacterium]